MEALVAPHPDSVDTVEAWLAAHGLDATSAQRSSSGDWITVRVSVSQAENMLGTKYNVFRHGQSEDYVIRTMNYSLPSILHDHITVVAPTTYFGTMKSMKATSFVQSDAPTIENDLEFAHLLKDPGSLATVPTSCNTVITPACLRALYNTAGYTPRATDRNSLGVAGYLDEFANRADLQVFCILRFLLRWSYPEHINIVCRRSSTASALMRLVRPSRRSVSTVAVMTSQTLVLRYARPLCRKY